VTGTDTTKDNNTSPPPEPTQQATPGPGYPLNAPARPTVTHVANTLHTVHVHELVPQQAFGVTPEVTQAPGPLGFSIPGALSPKFQAPSTPAAAAPAAAAASSMDAGPRRTASRRQINAHTPPRARQVVAHALL
jgi:hypothetical protein